MRLEHRLKLREAAEAIGMTKELWSSYEYGRAPVRYWLGRMACEQFGFSQKWLATGQPPRWHYVQVPKEVEGKMLVETLFSRAYDEVLAPLIEPHYQNASEVLRVAVEDLDSEEEKLENLNAVAAGLSPERVAENYFRDALGIQRILVPDRLIPGYYKAMLRSGKQFLKEHWDEVAAYRKRVNESASAEPPTKKTIVDKKPAAAYPSATDMKTRWKDYQKKLKELCKVRGVKAAIAKKLKVSRTMVSKWVDGSEPSYDLAVQVIEWIDKNWKATPET